MLIFLSSVYERMVLGMNIWTILGIEKTKDKDKIKAAYRGKLVGVNPEDNQEGFMALRKAYEEAMYEADMDDEDNADVPKKDSLEYELQELYNDFERRINPEEWKKIFDRDEFISLDTAQEYRDKVLVFLMDYSLVPQQVYILVSEFFNVVELKDELCERFPVGFINHIIDNAKYRDPISYYLFDGDYAEIDKYIDIYYGLDHAIRIRNVEEQARLIGELEAIDLYHPYLEICKLRHEIHKMNQTVETNEERYEKYKDQLKQLQINGVEILNEVPEDDYYVLMFCGDIALINNDLESTEIYYNKLIELEPENNSLKNRLGDLYCAKGEYEAARDLFMKLLDINQYDEGARYGLVRANNGLIEKYLVQIEEEPENEKLKYELVWCYYRNGMFDKCVDYLNTFEPTTIYNKCVYYDLLGRNYMYVKEFDKALESLFAWRDTILEISEDDESEEGVKNRNRYHYVNYYIGECYISLKNYDEARKYLQIATEKKHEFIEYAYDALAKLEYETGNYDDCLKLCDNLYESSIAYDAYMYTAKCFYQLDEYGNSIDACEMCIRIQPSFYDPYVLMLRMYWECEEYDHLQRVINRFDELGYPNDDVDYYKARIAMRNGDNEEAIELFMGILERKGTPQQSIEDEYDYLNVYTLIATCYERLNQEEKALTYLEMGLEAEPDDKFFLNRIANVCHVLGDFERSIQCCDRILETTEDEAYKKRAYDSKAAALACLKRLQEAKKVCEVNAEEFGLSRWFAVDYGELLVRMNDLDGAVRVMEEAIAQTEEENDNIKFLLGNLCCFYGNEGYVDKAYEVFERGAKLNPDDYQLYRSMGFVFLDHGRYEDAYKLLKKAFEIDTERNSYNCGLILQAVRHFDDINKPEYKQYFEVAEEQFKEIKSGYAHIKYSEYLWATGRFEEAIESCQKALNRKRSNDTYFEGPEDVWHELGVVYFNMGDYAKSKECYEKAQEIFGHNQLFIDAIAECERMLEQK